MLNESQNIADLVAIEHNLNTRHAELVRQMASSPVSIPSNQPG
jgi:hypothetical protein